MAVKPSGSDVPPRSPSWPTPRCDTRAVLSGSALALVAVPFLFTLLLVVGEWAPLVQVDNGARDRLHDFAVAHPWFVHAMQLISNVGSAVAWLIVMSVVLLWLLWRRRLRLAGFVVVTATGSSLLNAAVKAAVDRPRPVLVNPVAHEPGLSFPSGHAQAAIVGYAILLVVLLPMLRGVSRRVAITSAAFMILAIGFSRVALGVHYLSDVGGGFILGAAWVTSMAAAFRIDSLTDRSRAHAEP